MSTTSHTPDIPHENEGIIVDADVHFTIDTTTRAISNQNGDKVNKKLTIMQYDNKSERYSFDMDRKIDGHDLTLCNRVQIHFINIGSNKQKNMGLYLVDDVKVSEDNENKITFSWLISQNATQLSGMLSFLVSFECVDGDTVLYRWSSSIFNNIQVVAGMDNDNTIVDLYVDELLAWQNSMESDYIPTLVDECYIEREFATSEEVAYIFDADLPAELYTEYLEDAEVNNDVLTLFKNDGSTVVFNTAATVKNNMSNTNLLLNGDFSINTQGRESYTGPGFGVNGWYLSNSGIKFNVGTKNLKNNDSSYWYYMWQFLNNSLLGKTVTLSAKVNGVFYSKTLIIAESYNQDTIVGYIEMQPESQIAIRWKNTEQLIRVDFGLAPNVELVIEYVKLDIGSIATAYSPNVVENYLTNNLPSNPNLLINGDFKVNQRGLTEYTTMSAYTVDRWKNSGTYTTVNADGSIAISHFGGWNYVYQTIEDYKSLRGKTVTFTVKIREISNTNGKPVVSMNDGVSTTNSEIVTSAGIYSITKTIDASATKLDCRLLLNNTAMDSGVISDISATIEWAKLEIGSIATPFSPRPYADELAMCQRYYQILRFHDVQYCSNTNTMYPNLHTLAKLRTTPTMTVTTNISFRGNGSILGEISSFTGVALNENIVVCNADVSGFDLSLGNLYAFTNGKVTVDAEIY